MTLNLIDIALDRITDFQMFERLANEVLYLDGWTDIRPMGGTADSGQDAVSEKYYRQQDVERTVFQYTLQKNLPAKIKDTIKTLRKNGISFSELVLVTPRVISTKSRQRMKQLARADHGVSLDVYERDAIALKLTDLHNGLFNRYFSNLRAQVEDITRAADNAGLPHGDLERTLLQVALSITFRPGSARVRKSILDHFVLAVVLRHAERSVPIHALCGKCIEALGNVQILADDQVSAAVDRLKNAALVREVKGTLVATEKAISDIAASTIRMSAATNSFCDHIVNEVESAARNPISQADRRRISRNTRAALFEVARRRGGAFNDTDPSGTSVPEIAGNQLDDNLAGLIVAAISDVLQDPTREQAETIGRWTQAYAAFALMGLDPALSALQGSRFGKKTFVLDTDIVLSAIVTENPISESIREVLSSITTHGARLVVPERVVDECLQHVERSEATYNYFSTELHQLTPAVVENRVWNVLVKGYYYARASGKLRESTSYREYLSNYYEKTQSRQFLTDVVRQVLPERAEIIRIEQLRSVPLDMTRIEEFAAVRRSYLNRSRKAVYRTQEEQASLANNDARLYLTVLEMNAEDERRKGRFMGGSCYLITEGGSYERVARAIGIHTRVTVRPGAVASVANVIGRGELSPTEFVRLFDNPCLENAVSAAWPDIQKLVKSGVDLRGKSLTRMKFDLDSALHEHLTELNDAQEAEKKGQTPNVSADEQFFRLLEALSEKGYRLIPGVEAIRSRVSRSERRVEELQEILDEVMNRDEKLEERITFFGQRRQKYLRRMRRSRGKHKK